MVGGHQRRPHVSPPCSPASWPRSCVLGLAQAPELFELPIRPWAPLSLWVEPRSSWRWEVCPGGSRLSAAVPSVPLAAQLCRRAGLLPLRPICGLAAGRASPRSSRLPPPPTPRPPPWGPTPFQAGCLACSRAQHTDRCPVAPFLPPRPSALLSRACCPKRMPSPWLRRKETWPQTLFWRPGRTSAHYRMAVARRCPPGLRLGILHSVAWLSASRLRGCAGFWGPVSVRVHVCLRDVRDCG